MRRIMLRPAWVLGLVLLVLLAMTGVAFGLWAKTLTIEGTVHTGELNAVYQILEIDESGEFNAGDYVGNGVDDELEGNDVGDIKDVGECTAELIDDGQFPDLDNPGAQGMKVTVTNAYPNFNCFVVYMVTNVGTIPLKIHSAEYSTDGINWSSAINTAALHVNGWPPQFDYDNDTQLHTDEFVYKSLHIALYQAAPMDAEFTFYVRHFVHQWNEEPL